MSVSAERRGQGAGRAHRRRSATFWARIGILALIPFVAYTLYSVAEKSVQTYRLSRQVAIARAEVEAERQENLRLQRALAEARSDAHIESIARQELNLVKPGDHPVVLTGATPPPTATPAPAMPSPPTDVAPAWLTWLLRVFGL